MFWSMFIFGQNRKRSPGERFPPPSSEKSPKETAEAMDHRRLGAPSLGFACNSPWRSRPLSFSRRGLSAKFAVGIRTSIGLGLAPRAIWVLFLLQYSFDWIS